MLIIRLPSGICTAIVLIGTIVAVVVALEEVSAAVFEARVCRLFDAVVLVSAVSLLPAIDETTTCAVLVPPVESTIC